MTYRFKVPVMAGHYMLIYGIPAGFADVTLARPDFW